MENIFSGRIQRVYIFKKYKNTGIAYISDVKCILKNCANFEGKECIVRFDLNQKKSDPFGNFITSDLSQHNSLSSEDYLLLGLWEKDMNKKGQFPTLEEINQYYDPGEMPQAVYLSKGHYRDSDRTYGRVAITCKEPFILTTSVTGIIRGKLPDPRRKSRVILTETEEDIGKVTESARNLQLFAVRMERLR
jgi:hypothetical protein